MPRSRLGPSIALYNTSRLASVVFYVLRGSTLGLLPAFLAEEPEVARRSLGQYLSWLVTSKAVALYGMKMPTASDSLRAPMSRQLALARASAASLASASTEADVPW